MKLFNRGLVAGCAVFFANHALAADWYRIIFEGTPEQVVDHQSKLIEKKANVTNPQAVEYEGKAVVLTGPYSDERVEEIKKNFSSKGLDTSKLNFFQLSAQPKPLAAAKPKATSQTQATASKAPAQPITALRVYKIVEMKDGGRFQQVRGNAICMNDPKSEELVRRTYYGYLSSPEWKKWIT